MRKKLMPLIAAAAAFVLAGGAFAAEPVVLHVHEIDERIGSMTVTFTVTDDSGLESTLTANELALTLDGKALGVASVEKTHYGRQPASVVLLVDVSGSMYGNPIMEARAALREFITAMEPDDQIAVMTFSTGVTLVQGFTSDRGLLDAAAGSIEAFGDTALFGAVNAAVELSQTAAGSKLIVLLSDGVATEGLQNRAASLSVAEQAGVPFVNVGLGPSIDVDYLRELSNRTGGRFIQTPTANQLRTAYTDVARNVVRTYFSDYRMEVVVPPTIDRTVDSTLRISARVRNAEPAFEAVLGPVEGAVPPPYEVRITGVASGSTLSAAATAGVQAPEGREITRVEFLLDGEVVGSSSDPAATHALDPLAFEMGTHTFAVRTLDAKGGEGYGEVSFLVPPPAAIPPPPAEPASLPIVPVLGLLLVGVIGFAVYRVLKARLDKAPEYVTKSLKGEPGDRLKMAQAAREPAARPARERAGAVARAMSRTRGRIAVKHESAILSGDGQSTREYDLGDAPLTVGTGDHCEIQLIDDSGVIAEEEARIWVQRGRITVHRLTALSAMATFGALPGWQFFDDGDELRMGPYRFTFQVFVSNEQSEAEEPTGVLPQEHGMTLRRPEPNT